MVEELLLENDPLSDVQFEASLHCGPSEMLEVDVFHPIDPGSRVTGFQVTSEAIPATVNHD